MKLSGLRWVGVGAVLCNFTILGSIEGCSGDDNKADGGDASDGSLPDVADVIVKDVANEDVVISDAGPDVTEIIAFQHSFSAAFCQRLANCCYSTQLDASAPDASVAACVGFTESPSGGGFENAIGDLADPLALNSGHIAVNESAKTSCLAGLATMTCGNMTGTEYDTLAKNCLSALSGTQNVGQPCRRSLECNNGFCAWPGDSGTLAPDASGACVPIAAAGASCDPRGGGNDECMYRGWLGTQQLRCDTVETVTQSCGTTGSPTFKCTPKLANDSGCSFEWECQGACGGNDCTCQSAAVAVPFPYFSVCPTYFGPDSGLQ